MDIHEYQAKKILSNFGIGIPRGGIAYSPENAEYEKYEKEEKFRTQGFNDFLIFSSQALGSLSAGYFLYLTNWQTINLFCLPLLLLIIYTSHRVNK